MLCTLPLLVLTGCLALQFIFCSDMRPYFALLLGTACALLQGVLGGRKWQDVSRETFDAMGSASPALALYLLVGPIISTWIAAGALPALVLWGNSIMTRAVYLPLSFFLMGLTGALMGTGVSALGVMGIALSSIGQAMGFPLWLTAGAVGSGAFWGNGVSPLAAVNTLTPAVVKCDPLPYRNMVFRRMAPPFFASILLFALAGFYCGSEGSVHAESLEELSRLFPFSWFSLLPPVSLLILIAAGFPSLPAFAASIALALAAALGGGNLALDQVPSLIMDGYRYMGPSPLLRSILNRGGLFSTMPLIVTIMLAMAFGGSYQASGGLSELLKRLTASVKTAKGLRTLALGCSIFTTAVTGSASLAAVLTGTLFADAARERELSPLDLSMTLGPITATASVLFPWGASGAALVSMLKLPLAGPHASGILYIPVCFAAFLTPLWIALTPLQKPGREKSSAASG